jgi:hypothetical protein
MSSNMRRLGARMGLLFVGLGLAGIATAGTGTPTGPAIDPVRCEIRTDTSNGMTSLDGMVHADRVVSGSYRFRVKSTGASGKSDIDQGGDFTAGPGNPAVLGSIMLDGAAARYDASLTVTVDHETIECRGGGI